MLVIALCAFFALAGLAHFAFAAEFAKIVPAPLPAKHTIVLVTGAIELALAVLIVPRKTRRLAGLLLAAYCLAVLPANVQMALDRTPVAGTLFPDWALWLRVALQFPLIALIVWATRRRNGTGPYYPAMNKSGRERLSSHIDQ